MLASLTMELQHDCTVCSAEHIVFPTRHTTELQTSIGHIQVLVQQVEGAGGQPTKRHTIFGTLEATRKQGQGGAGLIGFPFFENLLTSGKPEVCSRLSIGWD